MGGVLESSCVGRVYGADGAVRECESHISKISLLHQVDISNYFMISYIYIYIYI